MIFFIKKKKQSLRYHETEYNKFGGENWINSIVSLAKYRGIQVEIEYAEEFYLMKYLLK